MELGEKEQAGSPTAFWPYTLIRGGSPMNPSQEGKQAITALYEAIGTADIAAIDRLFSDHAATLIIGSDPEEWWKGHNDIIEAFSDQLQHFGTRQIVPGDLEAYS
jgi:hypothetical protein